MQDTNWIRDLLNFCEWNIGVKELKSDKEMIKLTLIHKYL